MVTVEVEVKLQVAFSGSEGHGIDIGVPRDAFGLRTRERQRFRDFLTSNCSLLVSRTSLAGLRNIRDYGWLVKMAMPCPSQHAYRGVTQALSRAALTTPARHPGAPVRTKQAIKRTY